MTRRLTRSFAESLRFVMFDIIHLELLEAFLFFLALLPSLEGLDITLVIRPDSVPDGRKGTRFKQG